METTPQYHASRILQLTFITSFLLVITIPTIVQLLHFNKNTSAETGEKRELVKRPPFALSQQFADSFEQYYNDNFGLREQLVHAGAWYKIYVFHTPMNPVKTLYGRDGMLFYNNSDWYDFIFGSYTHQNVVSEDELKKYVTDMEKRASMLDSQGIKYIRGFWPNPHTIYPELMPLVMRLQIKGDLSKGDQVVQYIKTHHSAIHFVDVRDALKSVKKVYRVYHKHDTHWNALGAFTGYQAMFAQFGSYIGIKPAPENEYVLDWVPDDQGDLFDMLGLPAEGADHGKAPRLTYKKNPPGYKMASVDGLPDRAKHTFCTDCNNRVRLLVFRDSYTTALLQFYSRDFYEVIYIWSGYTQELVDKIKPDIVIDIPAERYL